MSKQKIFLSFLALVFLAALLAVFLFWLEKYGQITAVTFLSVGEGDAILISQGQSQILIDGGRSGKELLAHVGRHMPFWDRTVEIVIATHPDADQPEHGMPQARDLQDGQRTLPSGGRCTIRNVSTGPRRQTASRVTERAPASRISAIARSPSPGFTSTARTASTRTRTSNPRRSASRTVALTQ